MIGEAKIFICYRRQDSSMASGRLYERLRSVFGISSVFIDTVGIQVGKKWEETIDEILLNCNVVLVVIGASWLRKERFLFSRLHNPIDPVRIEIEKSLKSGKILIPILLDGAKMPTKKALPKSLYQLTEYHAITLTHQDFDVDIIKLIESIDNHLGRGFKLPVGTSENIDITGYWEGEASYDAEKTEIEPKVIYNANFIQFSNGFVDGEIYIKEHTVGSSKLLLQCRGRIIGSYFVFDTWVLNHALRASVNMLFIESTGRTMSGMSLAQPSSRARDGTKRILLASSRWDKVT